MNTIYRCSLKLLLMLAVVGGLGMLGRGIEFAPAASAALPPPQSTYSPLPNIPIAPARDTLARESAAGSGPGLLGGIYPTTNMTYHGGVVQHTVTVYTIFWDPSASISQGYKDLMNRYFRDVDHSLFYNINTQYYDNVPLPNTPMLQTSVLGGTWTDTTRAYPHAGSATDPLLDADIRSEVDRAQTQNGWPAPGVTGGNGIVYFIYTARGIESCVDATHSQCTPGVVAAANHYCAYHFWVGGTGSKTYANMPYSETWNTNCRGFSLSPNGDIAGDAEVSITSHEHFEAATDPYGDAWYDTAINGEDGDKCAYVYGDNDSNGDANAKGHVEPDGHNLVLNGHPYIIQLEWSNADLDPSKPLSGCVSGRPKPVGGVSLDPGSESLPLQSQPSSSSDAWLLAEALAGTAATAVALGGAAWYVRRRRVQ